MSVRMTYEHELEELNQALQEMAKTVASAIEQTFQAFEQHDLALAEEIIRSDREVNEMEKKIEARCLNLILRQQPVAKDLRHISMALKVVTDLERIGDHASDIAELVQHLEEKPSEAAQGVLPAMVSSVKKMLEDAMQTFMEKDQKLAKEVEKRDDVIDDYFNQVKEEVIQKLKAGTASSDQAVDSLMIAKYLERIGDHAVNVCEWTEFYDTGEVNHYRIL